jgi:predicted DNA-binding protein with PD1-like motif
MPKGEKMTEFKPVKSRDIFVGKLSYNCDLLEEFTNLATKLGVGLGRVEAIGAVQKARMGFYNQETRIYQFSTFDQPMEITKLVGNVSLKDGNPFVHAHITLSDSSGKTYGGHLATGTIVFACEFILQAFDGPVFNRCLDDETGLALWLFNE